MCLRAEYPNSACWMWPPLTTPIRKMTYDTSLEHHFVTRRITSNINRFWWLNCRVVVRTWWAFHYFGSCLDHTIMQITHATSTKLTPRPIAPRKLANLIQVALQADARRGKVAWRMWQKLSESNYLWRTSWRAVWGDYEQRVYFTVNNNISWIFSNHIVPTKLKVLPTIHNIYSSNGTTQFPFPL